MRPSSRWALIAAAVLALVGIVAVYLAGLSAPPPPAAGCRQELSLIDDDGTALPAALYRCQETTARRPALLVWADSRRRARPAVAAFDAWARGGRSLWVIEAPPRPEALERQVRAALEMLGEDPWVDSARITLVAGASLLPLAAAPPEGLRVVLVLDRQAKTGGAVEGGVEVLPGGWTPETLGSLAERLLN